MKYDRTASFDGDYERLDEGERGLFKAAVALMIQAAREQKDTPPVRWPKKLRIKLVQGTAGIYEMTWSFTGPDGRATFEFVKIDGEPGIRWRRIGDHSIFKDA